jgi:hypothetical protein
MLTLVLMSRYLRAYVPSKRLTKTAAMVNELTFYSLQHGVPTFENKCVGEAVWLVNRMCISRPHGVTPTANGFKIALLVRVPRWKESPVSVRSGLRTSIIYCYCIGSCRP